MSSAGLASGTATPGSQQVLQLPVGAGALWATVHRPPAEPHCGVLLAAPFASEKVKAHRTLRALALDLAARGFLVLRFDHRGEGDGSGDFAQHAVDDRLADLRAAVAWLRQQPGLRAWAGVGLRVGATLLAAAARPLPGSAADAAFPCRALSLLAPVPDLGRHLLDMLRANLVEQGERHGRVLRDRDALVAAMRSGEEVPVDGFPFTAALLDQAAPLRLAELLADQPAAVQILDLDRGQRPVAAALAGLGRQACVRDLGLVTCSSRFWLDFRYHRPHEAALFARCGDFLTEQLGDVA